MVNPNDVSNTVETVGSQPSSDNPFAATRHALAALALGALASTTQPATAQEVRVAQVGEGVEGTVEQAFEGLPMSAEDISAQAEMQRAVSEVSALRQNGQEYYGPYLAEFESLSLEAQYQIALLIYPENSEGGPDYPSETIELVRNLRLPEEMIRAILAEATVNGADEFFELPGFEQTLYELRNNGEVGVDSIGYVIEKAPASTSQLYIVVLSDITNQQLADAQGRLVDAQGRLVDAQGRLVDAQGRLVDAQGRLVDAQGRLITLEELGEQQDRILND